MAWLSIKQLEDLTRRYWIKPRQHAQFYGVNMPVQKVKYMARDIWEPLHYNQFERLKEDIRNELKESVTDLIKRGISRNPCRYCTSLGRYLCHCPLPEQGVSKHYSFGFYADRSYALGCPAPKTKVTFQPNYTYMGFPQSKQEADLDEVVDHLLLDVEIEIEASL
jgi:hypothetical protein